MNNKKAYIILLIIAIVGFVIYPAFKFIGGFAGSYHSAEWYVFDQTEGGLIETVTNFKNEHPDYKVMIPLESGELEELQDEFVNAGYYYKCKFYLKDEKVTFSCVIHKVENVPETTIGLVSVIPDYDSPRLVNKELGWDENRKMKKLFEQEILNKLGTWKKIG